jgi:hypothetical protein
MFSCSTPDRALRLMACVCTLICLLLAIAAKLLAADCVIGCNESGYAMALTDSQDGSPCSYYVGYWCIGDAAKRRVTVDVGGECKPWGGTEDVQEWDCAHCDPACNTDTTADIQGVDPTDYQTNCERNASTFLRKFCNPP